MTELQIYQARRFRHLRDIDELFKIRDRKVAFYQRKRIQIAMQMTRLWYYIKTIKGDETNSTRRYIDLYYVMNGVEHRTIPENRR